MKRYREVEIESEGGDTEKMPKLDNCSDEDFKEPVHGEILVTRHALSVQIKEDETEQQRDNIFHTRCLVQGCVCNVIVDGRSCTNMASPTMVEKLGLTTILHP